MKKLMAIIRIIMLSCLLLTGCGVSYENREDILACLEKESYIGENDTLEETRREMESLVPGVRYYDYFYSDEDGEMYTVRIYPAADEDEKVFDVTIYYDIEIVEETYGTGEDIRTRWKMEEYEDFQELQVEQKKFLIWKWFAVAE